MLHPLCSPEHYGKLMGQSGMESEQCPRAVRASGLPVLLHVGEGLGQASLRVLISALAFMWNLKIN